MRHEIDLLLLELWQDTRCRSCIKQQATTAAAGGGGGLFASFVSAVLNDLMYLSKDSLERLADIKQIEDSKKDTKVGPAIVLCLCRIMRPLTAAQPVGLHRCASSSASCSMPPCLQVWATLAPAAEAVKDKEAFYASQRPLYVHKPPFTLDSLP